MDTWGLCAGSTAKLPIAAVFPCAEKNPETVKPDAKFRHFPATARYWLVAANDNRAHGKMVYLDGSLSSAPFWEDASAKLRLIPDDDGEYWLVTGETHKNPNRMIYIAGSGNSGNFGHFEFNKDRVAHAREASLVPVVFLGGFGA